MTLLYPSAEQVGIAWIKSLDTVNADVVATAMPSDPTEWATNGLIQVGVASGVGRMYSGTLRNSVLQIDCWATNPGSQKVPWGKAAELASQLWYACDDDDAQQQRLQIGNTPGVFLDVSVFTVYPLSDMRRLVSGGGLDGESTTKTTRDPSMGYARIQFDLQMNWLVRL